MLPGQMSQPAEPDLTFEAFQGADAFSIHMRSLGAPNPAGELFSQVTSCISIQRAGWERSGRNRLGQVAFQALRLIRSMNLIHAVLPSAMAAPPA
jgi:hypothetical protein